MSVTLTRQGPVATLTIDRPESRNALSDDLLGAVVAALREAERAGDVTCVVITGQERSFSAGADLSELAARSPVDVLLGQREAHWRALREVRLPLVAAVSGACLGGGFELALSCDVIVASPTARFGLPETGLGLIPGGGGSQLLVRLVGRAVAADLILTGRRLGAEEAHRLGIVARLAEEGRWLEEAMAVAAEISARPRVAQLLAKQAIWAALEMPLSSGIAHERACFQVALASGDAREGLASFLERREPVRTGG